MGTHRLSLDKVTETSVYDLGDIPFELSGISSPEYRDSKSTCLVGLSRVN